MTDYISDAEQIFNDKRNVLRFIIKPDAKVIITSRLIGDGKN